MINTDPVQIAWAAGLFEGEGCISINKSKRFGRVYSTALLSLQMTDEDSVQRFADIVGMPENCKGPHLGRTLKHKPVWRWCVMAKKARTVIHLLYPHLGKRRRQRADDVLEACPGYKRVPPCKIDGCDQKHFGRGFCQLHYEKDAWQRKKAARSN